MHKFQVPHVPIYSPDTDVFSTPPSTPGPTIPEIRPSLSRRSSRPSSLVLSHNAAEWNTSIIVDSQLSPDPASLIPASKPNNSPVPFIPPNGIHVNGVNGHSETTTRTPTAMTNGNGHHPKVVVSPHSAVAPTPTSVTYRTQPPQPHQIISPSAAQTVQNHHNQQHNRNQFERSPLSQDQTHISQPHSIAFGQSDSQHISSSQSPTSMAPAVSSPCFVHSQLQGHSLLNSIRDKSDKVKRSLGLGARDDGSVSNGVVERDTGYNRYLGDLEEQDSTGSLTKQLAETAVGVREMSKQLGRLLSLSILKRGALTHAYIHICKYLPGRTRVHSTIQSILIVTKARDNRLIQLTRELALYLMLKPQKNGRGVIVYVRFWFRPFIP